MDGSSARVVHPGWTRAPNPTEPHPFEPSSDSVAAETSGTCQLCGADYSDPVHSDGGGPDEGGTDEPGADQPGAEEPGY